MQGKKTIVWLPIFVSRHYEDRFSSKTIGLASVELCFFRLISLAQNRKIRLGSVYDTHKIL
jgi:hypothetical protein